MSKMVVSLALLRQSQDFLSDKNMVSSVSEMC